MDGAVWKTQDFRVEISSRIFALVKNSDHDLEEFNC
jgi:hypothetical protein